MNVLSDKGSVTPATEAADPVFTVQLNPNTMLNAREHLDIEMKNFASAHPNGETSLHIHYEDIPGYWDGEFTVTLQKAPLLFLGRKVAIGTASPGKSQITNGIIVGGPVELTNSDLYFTKTDHNHTGFGNVEGQAAIENAADYKALMLLGRQVDNRRVVRLWDYLEVNGNLDVTGNVAVSGKHAFRGNDDWLRLNQDGAFRNGVHAANLFTAGCLNIGGVNGWANPGNGVAVISGQLGIGTFTPTVELDVNGGGYFSGRVGIGTSNPGAPLHVDGLDNRTQSGFGINAEGDNEFFGITGNQWVSIKSQWYVEAYGFVTNSDGRIKNVMGRADGAKDLETIGRLRVVDYAPKGSDAVCGKLNKGFVAQEVLAVIPDAVRLGIDFIPNILSVAERVGYDNAAQTLHVILTEPHEMIMGDTVRLIWDAGTMDQEVVAVPDERSFIVGSITHKPDRLFVYGKRVNDFLSLDYNRIFSTGISAIQQLKKEMDEKLNQKDSEIVRLSAAVEALEARLLKLENASFSNALA
ncbi:MAG: tail fiber domain-containing protein [Opitutaceae bacterium]|nr:tail fiber domain-containing protein [Verrucomicrobiales bacterium]